MSTQKDLGAARKDDYHYMTSNCSLSFPITEVQRLARWSMELFTEWLLDGETFDVDHSFDHPGDHSGILICRKLTEEERREIMSETLGEWMRSHYSGNSTASYASGCGFFHDNYQKAIEDYVQERISEVLKSQVNGARRRYCGGESNVKLRIKTGRTTSLNVEGMRLPFRGDIYLGFQQDSLTNPFGEIAV